MSVQVFTNLCRDPRAVTDLPDDSSRAANWGWGSYSSSGSGVGDATTLHSPTGGPAGIPSRAYNTYGGFGSPNNDQISISYSGWTSGAIAVTPGTTVTAQMWGRTTIDVGTPLSQIRIRNAADGEYVIVGELTPHAYGTWETRAVTFTVPSGVTAIKPEFTSSGSAGSFDAYTISATGLTVVVTDASKTYSGGYFDGDMPPAGVATFAWTGTPHASTSIQTLTFPDPVVPLAVPTATPVPPAPKPGVLPRTYKTLQATDYSVTEDSTPVDPSDSSGGTGQFTFSATENDETRALIGVPLDLSVKTQGTTRGTVRGLGGVDGTAVITADSRLTQLSVIRQAQPFTGTLGDAFEYYLGLCSITTGLVVDPSIAATPVVFPGWSGNVWDQMKKMAVAQRVEVSLVSNNVVLRPLRGRVAENYRDASVSWSVNTSQLARSIEIYYYGSEYKASALAYPIGGWNPDVQILAVDAGETQEFDLPLSASMLSIDQPVCVDWVDRMHESTSVYSVVGNDGLPVPPAQWADGGGKLSVAINDDTRSLTVTITGSSEAQYAPYRIAMASGTSDDYSSLRIVGEGVFFDKQLLTMNTHVNPDVVSQEVGATIDNEFIRTRDDAVRAGLWALKRWGSPRQTIDVTTTGINRLGDNGSYRYPTVGEVNAAYAGMTLGEVSALFATIRESNDFWVESVRHDFANQAFGNVAGARVKRKDAYYRIRSASNSAASISYSAEGDTTVGDVNLVWVGATIAELNELWAGRAISESNAYPLRRSA